VRRVRVRIRGRVQGVFFRAEARARAESLGLAGWIRNEPDGSISALFEGEPEPVESVLGWCLRGPRGAHVDEVEVSEEAGPREASGFRVL
jgi:acylphosphatase